MDVRREMRQAHERHVHRDLRTFSPFEQSCEAPENTTPAAHIENRLLGLGNRFSRLLICHLFPSYTGL